MTLRLKQCLRTELDALGWSPGRLNREVGWNKSWRTIYNLLDPERSEQSIGLETLDALCALLGKTPNDLLERVPDPTAREVLPHAGEEVCDRHAGRGWDELTWNAGAHCPLCRQEKGIEAPPAPLV